MDRNIANSKNEDELPGYGSLSWKYLDTRGSGNVIYKNELLPQQEFSV
jgi:hypothetical protein